MKKIKKGGPKPAPFNRQNQIKYQIIDSKGKIIDTFRQKMTADNVLKTLEKMNWWETYTLEEIK